ncbi:dihydrofolate reductase family protein [Actinomadura geliboluensis]|uniref:dihydrofolate reductase family protein n=1 Tax=Actinomadura geliboluensis TaxID=882440 RepID=UPI0036BD02D2
MATIRLYMTMSLDGYVAGPQDGPDAPMGIGGFRLFNWLDRRNDPGPSGQVYREVLATRAVISGRRTYEHAGRWQGDHHDGVPVFVLTHDVPDDPPPGSVRYVTDAAECAARARAAAGDADVMVHGAGASSQSCSARAAACSTTSHPNTSNWTRSAAWPPRRPRTPQNRSCTCATASTPRTTTCFCERLVLYTRDVREL